MREYNKVHMIILITSHEVNSMIVFICGNFNLVILSQIIRDKRKKVEKKPIKIEVLVNIGNKSRNAKILVDIIKKVKIDAIDRLIP
jgi:hypothetical protein